MESFHDLIFNLLIGQGPLIKWNVFRRFLENAGQQNHKSMNECIWN